MLWKGLVLGFSIAAPVGPIGLLVLRRGLLRGFGSAFSAGLGAATADALYGLVGALGLSAVTTLLTAQGTWLRAGGGLLLLWMAWQAWQAGVAKVPAGAPPARPSGHLHGYAATLLLTLSNPMTILVFATLFAGLGLTPGSSREAISLVAGVFLGSALWWAFLASAAARSAVLLTPARVRGMNRLAALVLAGFGMWALASIV